MGSDVLSELFALLPPGKPAELMRGALIIGLRADFFLRAITRSRTGESNACSTSTARVR